MENDNMACSRDSGCLTIAKRIYPELQSKINNSTNTVKTGMNEIIEVLDELFIPQDYLGTRVKEKIDEICEDLGNDVNINDFIVSKIKEHKKHYELWHEKQEEVLEEQTIQKMM